MFTPESPNWPSHENPTSVSTALSSLRENCRAAAAQATPVTTMTRVAVYAAHYTMRPDRGWHACSLQRVADACPVKIAAVEAHTNALIRQKLIVKRQNVRSAPLGLASPHRGATVYELRTQEATPIRPVPLTEWLLSLCPGRAHGAVVATFLESTRLDDGTIVVSFDEIAEHWTTKPRYIQEGFRELVLHNWLTEQPPPPNQADSELYVYYRQGKNWPVLSATN